MIQYFRTIIDQKIFIDQTIISLDMKIIFSAKTNKYTDME